MVPVSFEEQTISRSDWQPQQSRNFTGQEGAAGFEMGKKTSSLRSRHVVWWVVGGGDGGGSGG